MTSAEYQNLMSLLREQVRLLGDIRDALLHPPVTVQSQEPIHVSFACGKCGARYPSGVVHHCPTVASPTAV